MTSRMVQYIGAFDGFKVLDLVYEQDEEDWRVFSMYLLLSDATDGLSALVEKVGSESGFLEHKLDVEKVEVSEFRSPRFKISFGLETCNMLKDHSVMEI
ncbi:putative Serpin family protein [Lupinus albus]|uniref:Putative Serpin family protein n=1 Tax=Lupinus albus TaxID=3870 RepID=A0A6A4MTV9_LUPAL|nr:putative Serpin family protein [Lupinus albus]